jgi:hypothetical protein
MNNDRQIFFTDIGTTFLSETEILRMTLMYTTSLQPSLAAMYSTSEVERATELGFGH